MLQLTGTTIVNAVLCLREKNISCCSALAWLCRQQQWTASEETCPRHWRPSRHLNIRSSAHTSPGNVQHCNGNTINHPFTAAQRQVAAALRTPRNTKNHVTLTYDLKPWNSTGF